MPPCERYRQHDAIKSHKFTTSPFHLACNSYIHAMESVGLDWCRTEQVLAVVYRMACLVEQRTELIGQQSLRISASLRRQRCYLVWMSVAELACPNLKTSFVSWSFNARVLGLCYFWG